MIVQQPEYRSQFEALWMQVVNAVYPYCYYIGIQTVRMSRIAWARLQKLLQPFGRLFRALWQMLIMSRVENLRNEKKRRHRQLQAEKDKIAELWEEDKPRAIWNRLIYPFRAVWIFRRLWLTGFNYLAPIAAICVMAITINQWSRATYALYVSFQGQEIGYVQDESVFEDGLELAQSRVAAIDNTEPLSADAADMAIRTAQQSDLLTDYDVCNAILRAYGDEVGQLTGLYVNGTLIGALESRGAVQGLLDSILEQAKAKSAKQETISFLETIEIVPGLYPSVSLLTEERMRELLTDKTITQETYTVTEGDTLSSIAREHNISRLQLISYNKNLSDKTLTVGQELVVKPSYAYLHIQSSRTEVEVTYLPYETVTVKDYNRYMGDNYVKVKGVKGEVETTYEVISIDGEEMSRKTVSRVQTKDPITQVNAQGAMNIGQGSGVAGDGIATGRFIWPIPGWYFVSSGYGWRTGEFHKGIDIYQHGIYGASIVAADGGKVKKVVYGWGGGYGNHVIIDHGNGYESYYTHCSAILVSVGDKVSQGQLIAKVGRSGQTTGPGMHFEIRRNGQYIDPLPLLNK